MESSRNLGVARMVLSVASVLFVLTGLQFARGRAFDLPDFKALYVGARCLASGHDPYDPRQIAQCLNTVAEGTTSRAEVRHMIVTYVNLPTTFLFTVPLSLLPWRVAASIWMAVTMAAFLAAAWTIWRISARRDALGPACLVGWMVANSQVLAASGNAAGLVISFCTLAAACFIVKRWERVGIVLMAVALLMKPHDSGFVWLFFLLSGGRYRQRALETLGIVAIAGLSAWAWTSHVAPNWESELNANISLLSASGGINDAGPHSAVRDTPGMVIDLQSMMSLLCDSPGFYNLTTYVLCGIPVSWWALQVVRRESSNAREWIALAAIIPVAILITYHKPLDARLLLLTVPAYAELVVSGGILARAVVAGIWGAFILVGDISLTAFLLLTRGIRAGAQGWLGKLAELFLGHPVPWALLMLSGLLLYVYAQPNPRKDAAKPVSR